MGPRTDPCGTPHTNHNTSVSATRAIVGTSELWIELSSVVRILQVVISSVTIDLFEVSKPMQDGDPSWLSRTNCIKQHAKWENKLQCVMSDIQVLLLHY